MPALTVSAANSGVKFGCQTNAWKATIRDFATLMPVLKRIKEFAFDGFEASFRYIQDRFTDARAARAALNRTALRFFGVHIFLLNYDPQTSIAPAELYRKVADGGALLGAERLILSGAGLIRDGLLDREALNRKCDALNTAAQYARSKGLKTAYHNHGAEFVSGGAEMQGLLSGTDPALVGFILDAGHARRAKVDVAGFLRKHHRRLQGVHLRDLSDRPGDNPELGPFDLAALAAAIQKTGWDGWLIVEEEDAVNKRGDAAVEPARQKLREVFKK